MSALKNQKSGLIEIINATNHRKVNRDSAIFMNRVANLKLEFDETEEFVDVCKAMEENNKMQQIIGAIEILRDEGITDSDITDRIIRKYNVTKEYVLKLLNLQKA